MSEEREPEPLDDEEEEFIVMSEEEVIEELEAQTSGLHIITILYDARTGDIPHLDLGECNPWAARTLLEAALQSLEHYVPPVNVTYKGQMVIGHEFDETSLPDEDE